MHEIPLDEEVVRGWFCHMASSRVSVAVIISILNGDEEGNQVVAHNEEDEQNDAVSDEHVEKREAES